MEQHPIAQSEFLSSQSEPRNQPRSGGKWPDARSANTKKKIGNYLIYLDQLLGKGAFANVYRGENMVTRQEVAVKEISN